MTDLILTNGRSPQNKKGDYITRAQAEQMVLAQRDECEKMIQWYMNQIPALVKGMIDEAIHAALTGYHQALQDRGIIPADEPASEP